MGVSSLEELVSSQEDAVLARMARALFSRMHANGFQTLSKKDMDLLIYYEMERAGIIAATDSNHNIARLLRLTVTRTRSLRRDSYARWATQEEIAEHLRSSLARVIVQESLETICRENSGWLKEGNIPLLLEHPMDRAEFEQHLKERHSVPRYVHNREVLLVHYSALLAVVPDILGSDPERGALRAIKSAIHQNATLKQFLTTDISKLSWEQAKSALNNTMGNAVERFAADPSNVGSTVALMAKVFGPLLS